MLYMRSLHSVQMKANNNTLDALDSVTRSSKVRQKYKINYHLPRHLSPAVNDTLHVERCNKDEFHIHHRYAAGGVCEQRMTALHNYIDRYGISVLCQK